MTCSTLFAFAVMSARFAHAQSPALDDNTTKPTPTTDTAVAPTTPVEPPVQWGVAVSLRQVWIPRWLLEEFLDHVAAGAEGTGVRADVIRRHGTLDIALGVEFEHVLPDGSGVWINHGDTANIGNSGNQAAVDYILSGKDGSNLGWITIDATWTWNKPITKFLKFHGGIGAGVGIITGSLQRYHGYCAAGTTYPNIDPACIPNQVKPSGQLMEDNSAPNCGGGQPCAKDGIPAVLPVFNAIIGLQLAPVDKLLINIEAGIRTLPFAGVTVGYLFF